MKDISIKRIGYFIPCLLQGREKLTHNTGILSVPDDFVHGFRPVTDKRDVAICII